MTVPPTPRPATTTPARDEAASGDRDTFVEISGVPGVTDDEIQFSVIGTKANNPLGTCILDCYAAASRPTSRSATARAASTAASSSCPRRSTTSWPTTRSGRSTSISANDTFGNFNATLLAERLGRPRRGRRPHLRVGHPRHEMAGREHIFGHIPGPCCRLHRPRAPLRSREQAGAHQRGDARLRRHPDLEASAPSGRRTPFETVRRGRRTSRRCTSRTTWRTGCPTASRPRSRP